jgi:hypothetical protein
MNCFPRQGDLRVVLDVAVPIVVALDLPHAVGGELTPTLMVRRRAVEERHRAPTEAHDAEAHVT